jgi:hypothetical protein
MCVWYFHVRELNISVTWRGSEKCGNILKELKEYSSIITVSKHGRDVVMRGWKTEGEYVWMRSRSEFLYRIHPFIRRFLQSKGSTYYVPVTQHHYLNRWTDFF